MELKEYSDNQNDFYDFIINSNNGTLMSSKKFLNYHKNKFRNHFICFEKNKKIKALIVGSSQVDKEEKIFYSHPGASFGGLITNELSHNDSVDVFRLFTDWLKNKNFDAFIFKELPSDNLTRYNQSLLYLFYQNNLKLIKSEISTYTDLNSSIEEIYLNFNKLTKRSLNKSSKAFYTKQSKNKKDIQSFYSILKNNLNNKHNAEPTHKLNDLIYLIENFDEFKLFLTYENDTNTLASGVLTVELNRFIVLAFYIATNDLFINESPVRQTIHESIKYSKNNGFKSFNFGISTENSGKVVNSGLLKFKESFGGINSLRNTYEYKVI